VPEVQLKYRFARRQYVHPTSVRHFFVREADKLVFRPFLANHSSPLRAPESHATVRCKSRTIHKLMHWIQLLRQYPTDTREIAQVIDLAFV